MNVPCMMFLEFFIGLSDPFYPPGAHGERTKKDQKTPIVFAGCVSLSSCARVDSKN